MMRKQTKILNRALIHANQILAKAPSRDRQPVRVHAGSFAVCRAKWTGPHAAEPARRACERSTAGRVAAGEDVGKREAG